MVEYGFERQDGGFCYRTRIAGEQFQLTVTVSDCGMVDTLVADTASGEAYVLHLIPDAVGAFVGRVRSDYEAVLADIAEKCFEPDVFKSTQARELAEYAYRKYGSRLEFLWSKFPDNAVLRRIDTGKWYAALLTVSRRKLGFDSDESVEIIDLRMPREQAESIVDGRIFLPGYHMNKRSWYTVVLDNIVPTAELIRRMGESHSLAVR